MADARDVEKRLKGEGASQNGDIVNALPHCFYSFLGSHPLNAFE
jgi:hypothetical protein